MTVAKPRQPDPGLDRRPLVISGVVVVGVIMSVLDTAKWITVP